MNLKTLFATKNRNYTYNVSNGITSKPIGIVVHSTGAQADTPNLKSYVGPDDGYIGYQKNCYFNKTGIDVCVHAVIGLLKDGSVATYQILPYGMPCWGCGRGNKGSYNYAPTMHIQFEICEKHNDEEYFYKVFNEAAEYCAYLCRNFNFSSKDIVSHKEAYKLGYASNHGDPEHWMIECGKDMNWFRNLVDEKMNNKVVEDTELNKKYNSLLNENSNLIINYNKLNTAYKELNNKYNKIIDGLRELIG